MNNWKMALAATSMLCAAQPALAQSTANAIGGTAATPTHLAGWSSISRGGTSCNTGAPASLTNAYINGSLAGRHGPQAGNQPIVARNFGGPFSGNGISVAPGGVLLHPANNGDCAILRYTVPATGRGLYTVTASFSSADANSMAGSGDGTNAMVLVNGSMIGTVVDTRRGPGRVTQAQVRLCPGDTVDFAVHMKTEMGFDSTNVAGNLQRTGDVSALACSRVVEETGGPRVTGDPRNIDAWTAGDPITMVGTPNSPRTNCCGPWAGASIIPALSPAFPTGAAGPFTMNFTPSSALNAQMSAYLQYLNALNPAVTQLTMTWQAANLGNGASAANTGTTIGAPETVTWSISGSTVSMTGGGFWTGAPFPLGSWIGFQTTLSVNGGAAGASLLGPDCRSSWSAWRAQVQQIVQGGDGGGRVVFESLDARGQVRRTRPIEVRPGMAYGVDGQILERPRPRF